MYSPGFYLSLSAQFATAQAFETTRLHGYGMPQWTDHLMAYCMGGEL